VEKNEKYDRHCDIALLYRVVRSEDTGSLKEGDTYAKRVDFVHHVRLKRGQ